MGEKRPSELYRIRALKSLTSAKDSIAGGHLETAVSRAYYACFYAIHSRLADIKEIATSHKQTAVKFRELFIKTKKLDKKYSDILADLSEWRKDADYAPMPEISPEKAGSLVQEAEDFVKTILSIPA